LADLRQYLILGMSFHRAGGKFKKNVHSAVNFGEKLKSKNLPPGKSAAKIWDPQPEVRLRIFFLAADASLLTLQSAAYSPAGPL
jgi:hypothetical protein